MQQHWCTVLLDEGCSLKDSNTWSAVTLSSACSAFVTLAVHNLAANGMLAVLNVAQPFESVGALPNQNMQTFKVCFLCRTRKQPAQLLAHVA